MRTFRRLAAVLVTASLAIWCAGCPSSSSNSSTGDGHEEHDHGEEGHKEDGHGGHGHEGHSHAAHGPHGGHIIELGQEEYHAEWTHDEEGKVTIYLLDSEMKKDVPIAADHVTIDVKIGTKTSTFNLAAVDPMGGDMPKASKFEIVDKGLLGVLESLSEGVTATLRIPDINGKPYEAKITHDDHKH